MQAINSLVEVMKLMGRKYITLVKMKVIGMLRYRLSIITCVSYSCGLVLIRFALTDIA